MQIFDVLFAVTVAKAPLCSINGSRNYLKNFVALVSPAQTSARRVGIRELKQRQRRRQQERHEFAYLVGKNNSIARPARAFFTFVHFVAVVSKTTT